MTIMIVTIQRIVAQHYGVSVTDMLSHRRTRDVAWPRSVAMYFSKTLTRHSLPMVGRHFGDRDHTTVQSAVRRVASMYLKMPSIATQLDELTEILLDAGTKGWANKLPREVKDFDRSLQMCGYELAIVPIGTRDENGFPKKKNGNEKTGAEQ